MSNCVAQVFKRALALILCCGYPTIHAAQEQGPSLTEITENFQKLVTVSHQEKVYVHTDKSIYLTGETVWFKAYCVEGSTHRLSPLTKVLNIDIINNQGKPVEQTRIKLTGGIGKGQIFIGPKLVTGHYSLRAYTSWMRNFENDFIFEKSITIINSSAPEKREYLASQEEQLIIDFFAEGGELVYGIESKIAIKVTDSDGSGEQVTGVVYDDNQNKVAKFITEEHGLGSFFLLPEASKSYHAVVTNDQVEDQTVNLPKPRSAGYVLTVTAEEDLFDVTVSSKSQPHESVYLIVHTRGNLKLIEDQRLSEGSAHFTIPKTSLDDGISHVTLMNSALLPVCERLIFKSPDKGPDLALTTDKSNYASREKVTIHIEAEQLKTGTVPSNLSMSVYKNDEKDNGSIVSNFLLTSDLKGYVENPDYYFDPNHESELDVLLLTHGWRRFLWDDIISGKEPVISYPPEIHSPILTGKVINTNSEAKLESVFWGFPGKFPTLNSAQLNSDGTFYFEVPFRIKNERVIFWSRDDTLKSDEIQLESSFILSSEAGKKGNSIEPKLREYIEHSNANIQINSVYRKQTQISGLTGTVPEATTPFYGMPDVHYKLDDYTRFVEMNEIFIEYIRSVVIKRRESKSYFYVAQRGRNGQKAFDLPTLVLFDGVPINDADFMLELDPLKVEEIDVVNEYYQIGVHQFDGILNFITYHGDLAGTPLPSNFIEKVYHALQTPREFYSPEYETADQKAGRTPDFRSVLLWEPNIDLGPSGTITIEFYTSDDNGSYKIDLQGVSESGIPLHAELEFKVNIDS